jgi:hypothetical protein
MRVGVEIQPKNYRAFRLRVANFLRTYGHPVHLVNSTRSKINPYVAHQRYVTYTLKTFRDKIPNELNLLAIPGCGIF